MRIGKICFVLLLTGFPLFAQTKLANGTLTIHQDINNNPTQFQYNTSFHTIVIAKSTTSIPEEAFLGAKIRNLTFEIPSSITVIPVLAFSDNYFLPYITLPESVTTIAASAFGSCTSLVQVNLPHNLQEIHETAFWNTRIVKLYIPDSVTFIGTDILHNTLTFNSIRLPADINIDENNPFYQAYVQNNKQAAVYYKQKDQWLVKKDMSEEDYYSIANR